NRNWEDNTVNAYAQQQGKKWMISMFGGLARHSAITQDGFALVACHEIAHHLGGAPKKSGWATIEGQADYAANLKCLRKVFADGSSRGFTRPAADDPIAADTCDRAFASDTDRALCLRGVMAGKSVTALFKQLANEPKDAALDTPDPAVVTTMATTHPKMQCRLDTYFQGSQCVKSVSEELSDTDLFAGTCNAKTGQSAGLRPRCWYKPPAGEPQLTDEPAPVLVADAAEFPVKAGPAFLGLSDAGLWTVR
ncbi:MAG TPA: hypothetical protein PL037_02940, partial [Elusimicrobiales bacterium]|nr:hypothetical protein [Elusimicrobiales bacterium]